MLVNHKLKCIFIHIPKTGGSSIREYLLQQGFQNDESICISEARGNQNEIMTSNLSNWVLRHKSISELKPEFNSYFKFAFVRNPWDIIVSSYFWWTTKTKSPKRRKYAERFRQGGFDGFIQSDHLYAINECKHNGEGQLLWLKKNGELNVDFIGRFENLQKDFDAVCEIIGLKKTTLAHKNKSQHLHYSTYYTSHTKELISEVYSKDVEFFGYKFENFKE